MHEDVRACEFQAMLEYFLSHGWTIERQEPGRRDAVLCRPRRGVRSSFMHLFGRVARECQHVWVAADGYVHDEWV